MQKNEGIFFYRYVCSKEWSNEPKRWDTKGYLLEYNYPHSKQNMKLRFPVRMQFDRLNFTNLVFFTFLYQQALAQLDKHKASL